MGSLSTSKAQCSIATGRQAAWVTACHYCAPLWLAMALVAPTQAASTVSAEPPAAAVDGVVMPAWVERAGRREPVFPGMVLQERDRIVTGSNARILLTLPEGSKVKLGENAQLGFDALAAKREGESVFLRSALNVLTGAFRFTTNALSKATNHREVNIRLATVTAGIRGTDLWGKQAGNREIVCLLEGKIEVARDAIGGQSTAPVVLDQALQFYIAPKGEPTLPIGRVADAQLAQWAAETEIARDAGGASVGGHWRITFTEHTAFDDAMNLYDELRGQGYPALFKPDRQGGKRVYLVQLANLSSEGDARALAGRLREAGMGQSSISH